jgi:hypothetical protein
VLKTIYTVSSVQFSYAGFPDLNSNLIISPPLNDVPTTFSLSKVPYIEGSVGIGDIFKLLRVDLIKRV